MLKTCCELRQKILLAPAVLSEKQCGIADSAVVDVMLWDVKSPNGSPVILFKFCPWCGVKYSWDPKMGIVQWSGDGKSIKHVKDETG